MDFIISHKDESRITVLGAITMYTTINDGRSLDLYYSIDDYNYLATTYDAATNYLHSCIHYYDINTEEHCTSDIDSFEVSNYKLMDIIQFYDEAINTLKKLYNIQYNQMQNMTYNCHRQ